MARECGFDIETVGSASDDLDTVQKKFLAESKDRDVPLMEHRALFGWTCRVVCVSIVDFDTGDGYACFLKNGQHKIKDHWVSGRIAMASFSSEGDLLKEVWGVLKNFKRTVGYNSRNFDLPVLAQRSLVLGVKVPIDPFPYRYKYDTHLDLADYFTGFGATRMFPLDYVCRAMGVESPKDSHNGADVESLWRDGKYAELVTYNLGDVYAVEKLLANARACGLAR